MIDDQSRLVPRASAVEALTQIRALCDEHTGEDGHDYLIDPDAIRAVLDAVPVDATPPQSDSGEVLVEDSWFKRDDLPEILGRYMRAVAEMSREIKALYLEAIPVEGVTLAPDADGLVHVEDGWRIRRTYTVGEPGEIVERLEPPR